MLFQMKRCGEYAEGVFFWGGSGSGMVGVVAVGWLGLWQWDGWHG